MEVFLKKRAVNAGAKFKSGLNLTSMFVNGASIRKKNKWNK
jgi:hypothetical protein